MNTKKKSYSEKVVQSGNLIERFRYEKSVPVFRKTHKDYIKPVGRATEADKKGKAQNRLATLKKNRKSVERIVHSNCFKWANEDGEAFHPVFLTLTFAENISDVDLANSEFKKFVQRLNWRVYGKTVGLLKYVAVMEFQKRGSIHFHCVFFNLPYISAENLTTIWRHGNVHASAVRHIGKVANYLKKQMRYSVGFDPLAGKKRYLTSRGLHKSKQTINDNEIATILANSAPTYSVDFESEYYGKIEYERRIIKRKTKK